MSETPAETMTVARGRTRPPCNWRRCSSPRRSRPSRPAYAPGWTSAPHGRSPPAGLPVPLLRRLHPEDHLEDPGYPKLAVELTGAATARVTTPPETQGRVQASGTTTYFGGSTPFTDEDGLTVAGVATADGDNVTFRPITD
ncbi:hypothetical protein NKG94_48065 [Micromonospora sp. M12]